MIDWDDAFDNSGYVAGSDRMPDRWAEQALAYRSHMTAEVRAQLDVAYGPDPRERFDLFFPETTPEGTVLFIHGGYWHLFDKSYWSHLANGCVERGWAVAVPSYPLAPAARISDITRAVVRLIEYTAEHTGGPLRLIGHSAGGHLVSRMMCRDVLPADAARMIQRVVSISGVHELLPLTATRMNETLRLTEDEALVESPARLKPLTSVPAIFWVGARERPEFLRQTRVIEERWLAAGADTGAVFESGQDHFSVIDSLSDPDGALTIEVLR